MTTPISSAGAITHGSAYAANVDLLGLTLIHTLGFTSSMAPGTPQTSSNQVIPTIGLGSLLSLGLIDQNSQSSIGLTATSTASSQIAGVSLLNGAITADVIRAQSNSTAEASGSNHGAGGSNYVNLKVNGVAESQVAPNTALAVTLGKLTVAKVVLNEDTGSIVTSGGLTTVTDAVNMVDITLLAPLGILPAGAHIIIGHAQTDATFPSQNPACGTTPGSVSGYAFTAYAHATLLNSQLINALVDNVSLPSDGWRRCGRRQRDLRHRAGCIGDGHGHHVGVAEPQPALHVGLADPGAQPPERADHRRRRGRQLCEHDHRDGG